MSLQREVEKGSNVAPKSNLRTQGAARRRAQLRISFQGSPDEETSVSPQPPSECHVSCPQWMISGKEYQGFCYFGKPPIQAEPDEPPIPRIPYSSITPRVFFERFVAPRRPCVLCLCPSDVAPGAAAESLRTLFTQWGQWTYLRRRAGSAVVRVERRQPGETYGKGRNEMMRLGDFLRSVDSGDESLYMTTQRQLSDSRGLLSYGGDLLDDSPISNDFPLVPPILCSEGASKPALYQYNLWIGSSAKGSTSGLHHDFHDNLYCVIKGTKIFRLFSPRCAEALPLKGKVERIHDNGLICYSDGIRTDGASEAAVSDWRRQQAQTELKVLQTRAAAVAQECRELQNSMKSGKGVSEELESRRESLALLLQYVTAARRRANEPDKEDEGENAEERGSLEAVLAAMSPEQKEALEETRRIILQKASPSAMEDEGENDDDLAEGEIPDHFCLRNTTDEVPEFGETNKYLAEFPPKEKMLREGFLEVALNPGEMLWLPASWFHEVISIDREGKQSFPPAKGRGHAAINFWLYPRQLNCRWGELCYPDGFWPRRAESIRERLAFIAEVLGPAVATAEPVRPLLKNLILRYGAKALQQPSEGVRDEEQILTQLMLDEEEEEGPTTEELPKTKKQENNKKKLKRNKREGIEDGPSMKRRKK